MKKPNAIIPGKYKSDHQPLDTKYPKPAAHPIPDAKTKVSIRFNFIEVNIS